LLNDLRSRTLPAPGRSAANIRTLEETIAHQNHELEASKILHNKMVEKLRQKADIIENLENALEEKSDVPDGATNEDLTKAHQIITKKDNEIQDLTDDIEALQTRLRLLGKYEKVNYIQKYFCVSFLTEKIISLFTRWP